MVGVKRNAHTPSLIGGDDPVSPAERNTIKLNGRVRLEKSDGLCVVWVHDSPWHRFAWSSKLDRRIVGANLVLSGLAKTVEVSLHLDINRDTLYRDRKQLLEGGLPALAALRRGPKGPNKAKPALVARARSYYREGLSKREIGRRLGLAEGTVRLMLHGEPSAVPARSQVQLIVEPREEPAAIENAGIADGDELLTVVEGDTSTRTPKQGALEEGSGSSEAREQHATQQEAHIDAIEAFECGEGRPGTDRSGDLSAFMPAIPHREDTTERDLDRTDERVWARFGLVCEAEVRYVPGDDLRFVGALLILPALIATGFFQSIEEVYGKLKNGFYGLRHTVMTVTLMLVLRLKRAEHLTGVSPTALGRLLGLDRAPEVKTLRRRLGEIAREGKADELMRWFARHLAEADPEAIGFLYLDGHTRVYFGKRKVSKAYSTRKRLALPAVTDFWVNDSNGQPVFVVTGEPSQALTRQLLPLIETLQDVLPAEKRRVTFLFDRGGWSPRLFRAILQANHDFITYRKGKQRRYRLRDFSEHTLEANGRAFTFILRDGVARFGVGLEFRQVVRRENDGHQIAIVTNRKDLSAAEVVYRLGERWRQENYFKYAGEEFALDALDSYEVEPDDPERSVPNPKRKELDKRIAVLRNDVSKVEAQLGHAADRNDESRRPTVRGFKIAHGALRHELAKSRENLEALLATRTKVPQRVAVAEASADETVLLGVEHKHFMNAVKMAVYRAESALFRAVEPHYHRNEDEGRALLREALRSPGSLEVANGELRVTLDPLSAPRRTKAIAALCHELNQARVRIPGTTLRLVFRVSRTTGVSELAMASCQEV